MEDDHRDEKGRISELILNYLFKIFSMGHIKKLNINEMKDVTRVGGAEERTIDVPLVVDEGKLIKFKALLLVKYKILYIAHSVEETVKLLLILVKSVGEKHISLPKKF